MSIEQLAALTAIGNDPAVLGANPAQAPQAGFATWFDQQLDAVNQKLAVADNGLQQLAVGNTSNLHQVMIQLEEAQLSVQLVMQIRNRLLEAYQDVMRMQM